MFWSKVKNENKNVIKELELQISNLELELTDYRDKVQYLKRISTEHSDEVRHLKNTVSILEQLVYEKIKEAVKDGISKEAKSQKKESKIEEFEKIKMDFREITIKVLKDEISELKKRLSHYIEKKKAPLDHYEYALTNYNDISIPIKAPTTNAYDRYGIQKLLPQEVKNSKNCFKWLKIQENFGYRCAITGNKHYEFEHFIPIHTGHGGAYEGNIIPMHWNFNSKKGNKNPFHWFRILQQRGNHSYSISLKRWDDLIGYLAEKHDLSVEDYFDFVNWCFSNPRTKEQLQLVNTPSIELWKYSKIIIK